MPHYLHEKIRKDVRKKHPLWTDKQVEDEVKLVLASITHEKPDMSKYYGDPSKNATVTRTQKAIKRKTLGIDI